MNSHYLKSYIDDTAVDDTFSFASEDDSQNSAAELPRKENRTG